MRVWERDSKRVMERVTGRGRDREGEVKGLVGGRWVGVGIGKRGGNGVVEGAESGTGRMTDRRGSEERIIGSSTERVTVWGGIGEAGG